MKLGRALTMTRLNDLGRAARSILASLSRRGVIVPGWPREQPEPKLRIVHGAPFRAVAPRGHPAPVLALRVIARPSRCGHRAAVLASPVDGMWN